MTIQEIKELALHAAKRTAPTTFSVDSVDAALLDAFKSMTGSINDFMRNKYDIFDIMIETADKVVPQEVISQLGSFCDIRQVGQGQTVMFKRGPIGRNRAKKFLTQVGLSGVYETFRLDNETYTVAMKSIGGAVTMDFERFLDGAENLADLMSVMAEAQVQGIYGEVQKALIAAASNSKMPAANKVTGSYSAASLKSLCNTVKAYGSGCTIFASPEFIDAMGPDEIGHASYRAQYAEDDINAIHNTGRIGIFRGIPVVELKQSFADDSNTKVVMNPQMAYVLPTGNEKVVKLVMEGQTQMYDWTNKDQSIEIDSYRKIGVGIVNYNNWGVYKNTSISDSNWEDYGVLGIDVADTDHNYPHYI